MNFLTAYYAIKIITGPSAEGNEESKTGSLPQERLGGVAANGRDLRLENWFINRKILLKIRCPGA